MQVNLKKIDERIQKLQEIKRIAADPELMAMLFEFIATEDERTEHPAAPAKAEAAAAGNPDESELVKQILKGTEGQGSTLWSRKRA